MSQNKLRDAAEQLRALGPIGAGDDLGAPPRAAAPLGLSLLPRA